MEICERRHAKGIIYYEKDALNLTNFLLFISLLIGRRYQIHLFRFKRIEDSLSPIENLITAHNTLHGYT